MVSCVCPITEPIDPCLDIPLNAHAKGNRMTLYLAYNPDQPNDDKPMVFYLAERNQEAEAHEIELSPELLRLLQDALRLHFELRDPVSKRFFPGIVGVHDELWHFKFDCLEYQEEIERPGDDRRRYLSKIILTALLRLGTEWIYAAEETMLELKPPGWLRRWVTRPLGGLFGL